MRARWTFPPRRDPFKSAASTGPSEPRERRGGLEPGIGPSGPLRGRQKSFQQLRISVTAVDRHHVLYDVPPPSRLHLLLKEHPTGHHRNACAEPESQSDHGIFHEVREDVAMKLCRARHQISSQHLHLLTISNVPSLHCHPLIANDRKIRSGKRKHWESKPP